jgi:hypothetical protein
MTRRAVITLVSISLIAAACIGGVTPPPSPESSSSRTAPTNKGSAAAARRNLCDVPDQTPPPGGSFEGATPHAVTEVERQVEQVRELRYTASIPVEAVTPEGIARRIARTFDQTYPKDLYARRSRAWSTMGLIPPGSSLRHELQTFLEGDVAGFYVPENGRLVFVGSFPLSPASHVALAHELTHALDDQHFRLDRLDPLLEKCADEREQAALGAVEGSAQFFSAEVALKFLSASEKLQLSGEAGAGSAQPLDVPAFVENMVLWPYRAGPAFISALMSSGGIEAVNEAIRRFPVSTEQVMHPQRYPGDVPTRVDIPDLGPLLGPDWNDLDVSDVGEAFLDLMLRLRLDPDRADAAAAGWDGGIYRAWTDGARVAVVMSTVWDTDADAREFAQTMSDWIDAGDLDAVVTRTQGNRSIALFASDEEALRSLERAARQGT